ncbi:GntR family transcriptional regulator [Amycolatopsis sp. OK19-0408]|uniref:GntR family transcriptional regulator n=1 Tax=Amycolatopsis iheyensis TaxID=2945988 RepID=A0A9X2NKI3_9PSEU|nr:GntR family transcriptional regulator [Amycolatopsis iheyensis]MCR6489201.1 GntR family transcriptional regulator [Amycolatopsis iheyensis]
MAVESGKLAPPGDSPDTTRASRAYADLRAQILAGDYEPNSRLTETELSARLEISRGTLRSVLARLAQEGYVTAEANRSARTRSFSEEEAVEILETREVLEAALAAKAAERATEEDIAALTETCERMRAGRESDGRDESSAHNRRFHELVRAMARQATLTRFVDSLLYPMVLRQFRDMERPRSRDTILHEHEAILAAIITHNPDAAAAAMRHHLSAVRRALQLGPA